MKVLPDPPRPTQHDPIAIALAEDIGSGDLTSRYFAGTERRKARIFAKEDAVVAGADTAAEVFGRVDPKTRAKIIAPSGNRMKKGDTVIEIEGAVIRAIAPDGRVTLAHARRAIGNGDGSEVQLLGGAEVTSDSTGSTPVVMRSEFLHAFLVTERVQSNKPVQVQMGGTELRAAGIDYDHAARHLELKGPLRAVMAARPPR